jgi:tRNA (cmo5U34)-methyltransferase
MDAPADVWKTESLTRTFLEGIRGGIPLAAEQIDAMLRIIGARGLAVRRFADLGCGSGVLARAVLSQHPSASAVLLDFSEPMLAEARRALAGHRPAPRFVLGDLGKPDWQTSLAPDAPLDLVVSGYAIHHLPHQRKRELYGEIFALLAPGGMFVNVEHVASATSWIENVSDELMIDSLHAFHRSQGTARSRAEVADEFVHRPDKAANILAPVEEQCRWLRDRGFADVDCYFKVFELAVFGGRRP